MSTIKANENNTSVRKDMRVEKKLLSIIDSVRGDVTFSAWVKRAIVQRLTSEGITVPSDYKLPATQVVSSSNHNGKGSYIYHTPAGNFTGRNPAAEANGLTPHTVAKRCKDGYEGYSLESI